MKQPQRNASGRFTQSWTEHDEAVFLDLLKRKISELRWEIKSSDSPYVRARLRARRKEYRALLKKVEAGNYDSNFLAAEFRGGGKASRPAEAGFNADRRRDKRLTRYIDSYDNMEFDFQGYFRKTRYFGTGLPFLMLLLTVALLFVMIGGAILPAGTLGTTLSDASDNADIRFSVFGTYYFKLDDRNNNFRVLNNGDWPDAVFLDPQQAIADGEIYTDKNGNTPEYVYLYTDLGMAAIEFDTLDVVKAVFRTPLFSSTRFDLVEDLKVMQGKSWYYIATMLYRSDDIQIVKDENGKYDTASIVRYVTTYGMPYFLSFALLFCIVELIINITRMFSYTGRRIHVMPILILICLACAMLCPPLMTIDTLSGDRVSEVFSEYFTLYWSEALLLDTQSVFSLIFALWMIVPVLLAILPVLFRNRDYKQVYHVPKGNKPHTFPGQTQPTNFNKKPKKGAAPGVARGSQPGYTSRLPYQYPVQPRSPQPRPPQGPRR